MPSQAVVREVEMRLGLSCVLVIGLLLEGCRTPRATTEPAAAVAALFYTSEPLGTSGLRLPTPLVHGTVGGRPTTMIVDTGAQVPVVATWLAREVGLEVTGMARGSDPAGQSVPMQRTARPTLAIEGWGPLTDRTAAVIDLPAPFRGLGIGAILSPQALATQDEAVILDMVGGTLRRAPVGRATAELSRLSDPFVLGGARVCAYAGGGFDVRVLLANASIDGVETTLELDTGTNKMFVAADTDLGRRLALRPDAVRADGLGAVGSFATVVAPGIPILVGGIATTTSIAVTGRSDKRCGSEGRFGMDQLRACVLVIESGAFRVSCKKP